MLEANARYHLVPPHPRVTMPKAGMRTALAPLEPTDGCHRDLLLVGLRVSCVLNPRRKPLQCRELLMLALDVALG